MNLQIIYKNFMNTLIILGLFLGFSFAEDKASEQQKNLVSSLDSIEENVIGFSLNGRAKGGVLSSTLSSGALERDVSEYSAFSDFLLNISVRPSNETKATFDLRFHKDWQNAYREGNNSPIIRWWSYDGNILDKKLKFNLGTMRLSYTPLTIYLPEPNLIMEPEIFSNMKREAMEDRYLDGTNRRLLQGLNAEYSMSAGFFDNIFVQGTLTRLRKNDKEMRIAYDYNPRTDRYSTAARLGAEAFGFSFVVNEVYAFDRIGSTVKYDDSIYYEKNNVLSFELGYNSKKLALENISFGLGIEYAISSWNTYMDKLDTTRNYSLIVDISDTIPAYTLPGNDRINRYPFYEITTKIGYKNSKIEEQNNKGALLTNAFVNFNREPFEVKLMGHFLQTDKYFEAELAASPAYLPNLPILNSNANLHSALSQFRSGSLENMYHSLYYSLPMNAATIVGGNKGKTSSVVGNEIYLSNTLYNNYKFSQYQRNSYTQETYTRMERNKLITSLDPAVNMALPYGYATPDRTGGDVDLDFVWNKSVGFKGVFGKYSSEHSDYTRFGGGLEVDVSNLVNLSNALTISASYEQNKEENGAWNPQVDRIMAGAKIGIWRGLSLIGGLQQLTKEFKTPYVVFSDPDSDTHVSINKTTEVMVIGGPKVKISEQAEFALQGGLMSNLIEGNGVELSLDKLIISGMVTVGF